MLRREQADHVATKQALQQATAVVGAVGAVFPQTTAVPFVPRALPFVPRAVQPPTAAAAVAPSQQGESKGAQPPTPPEAMARC